MPVRRARLTLAERYVSLREAAETAGCSTARLRMKLRDRTLSPVKIDGRVYLRTSEFADYMARRAAYLAAVEGKGYER